MLISYLNNNLIYQKINKILNIIVNHQNLLFKKLIQITVKILEKLQS